MTRPLQPAKPKTLPLDRNTINRIIEKQSQRPEHQSRKIKLRYKVADDELERIIKWYKRGSDLVTMLKLYNGSRAEGIALCDMYTILFRALQAGKIQQRKENLAFELKLVEFAKLYRAWTTGVKPKDIQKLIECTEVAMRRAIRSLTIRLMDERQSVQVAEDASAKAILSLGRIELHNGRQAIVIYRDEIPTAALESLSILENLADLSEEFSEEELSTGKSLEDVAKSEKETLSLTGNAATDANPHGVVPRIAPPQSDDYEEPIKEDIDEDDILEALDAAVPLIEPTGADDLDDDVEPDENLSSGNQATAEPKINPGRLDDIF